MHLKKNTGIFVVCLFSLTFLITAMIAAGGLAMAWAAPDKPFLTWSGDPQTSQTITWLMPADCPEAKVQYLKESDYTGSFEAAAEATDTGRDFGSSNTDKLFSAELTGLTAGTRYVYRVGAGSNWGEPRYFTTAPADTGGFSFVYLGDAHFGYSDDVPNVWEDLLAEAAAQNPDLRFALQGGDLTDSDSEADYRQFFDVAGGFFSRIPFMPAKGNHDGILFENVFRVPDYDLFGFYSFDYGDVHFAVLNSAQNATGAAVGWLQRDLEESNSKWKFVVFHHPAYYIFDDGKTSIYNSIRANWAPILEENMVDLAFVGHQHVYMRTKPVRERTDLQSGQDMVYIMGVSGTKFYNLSANFDYIDQMATRVSNCQIVSIDGNNLTLRSIGVDGQTIDSYQITKKNAVEGVSLNKSTGTIAVNEIIQLTAMISPANADNKNITWHTSNENVAAVDASGLVTGINPGTAVITATTEEGGYTAACTVEVLPAQGPVLSLTVQPIAIVQNHLSYIHVHYDEAALQNAYFALLSGDGEVIGNGVKGADGKAVITVTAPDVPGVYKVAALLEGVKQAEGSIEVTAYNDNIWEANASINEDGCVVINFNESIAEKNYSLTVNGTAGAASGEVSGGKSIVTDMKYDSLPSGESTFSVSGVKYPRLYPSYTFTFTAKYMK